MLLCIRLLYKSKAVYFFQTTMNLIFRCVVSTMIQGLFKSVQPEFISAKTNESWGLSSSGEVMGAFMLLC